MIKKIMLLLKFEDLEELISIVKAHYFRENGRHPKWLIYLVKRFYSVKYNGKR